MLIFAYQNIFAYPYKIIAYPYKFMHIHIHLSHVHTVMNFCQYIVPYEIQEVTWMDDEILEVVCHGVARWSYLAQEVHIDRNIKSVM